MTASTAKDLRWSEDVGPTDVARANGEVLGAAASLVVRALSLVALVLVGAFATLASRGVAAGSSVHASGALLAESARDLGVHFVLVSALLVVVVMLGSTFLWRLVLAPGRPGAFIRLLDEARRSILRARGAGDLAALRPLSVNRRYGREAAPGGVLEQLRQSLILSPLAPPRGLVDPFIVLCPTISRR